MQQVLPSLLTVWAACGLAGGSVMHAMLLEDLEPGLAASEWLFALACGPASLLLALLEWRER